MKNTILKLLIYIYYFSLVILFVIYLFPGSLIGYFLYGKLGQQPNLIPNPIGTSINHLIFFSYITILALIIRPKVKNILTDYKVILFISFICSAQQTLFQTIFHDNIDRHYIIHIPESYNDKLSFPLVLCFHGYGGNASGMSYTNFNYVSDTANFIVVYPQGTLMKGKTHWNVGGWTLDSNTDDLGFISN